MTNDEPAGSPLGDAERWERMYAAPTPEAGRVGEMLFALRRPSAGPVPGEAAARAAFQAFHAAGARAPRRSLSARLSGWAAALTLTGGFVVAGGVAAAATGHLPNPVIAVVHDVFGSGSGRPPGGGSAGSPPRPIPAVTPSRAPSRMSTSPRPGQPTAAPGQGRSPLPVHPTHPVHPSHPTVPEPTPTHEPSSHPSHSPKPHPTHTPKPHPTHTPKPHPTHTPKPHPTHTPKS
jgi:hypothetical protein